MEIGKRYTCGAPLFGPSKRLSSAGLRAAGFGRFLAVRLLYSVVITDKVTCQIYTVPSIVNLKVTELHFVYIKRTQ
jgi:hypothetical protein